MDRGILMKPELSRQTMDGNKTETRRLRGLKEINIEPDKWRLEKDLILPPHYTLARIEEEMQSETVKCPYGVVGDRLYVKEPHYRYGKWRKNGTRYGGKKPLYQKWRFVPSANGCMFEPPEGVRVLPNRNRGEGWYKRSPLFMEKKHARIWLEITGIWLERLGKTTEEGAKAEGVNRGWYLRDSLDGEERVWTTYMRGLEYLWDKINPAYLWSLNPWVWVVQYKLLKEIDK